MPKGYWIAHIDVEDAERYPEYVRRDTPIIEKWGGRFIVRAGRYEAPEGAARSRHVVVEFDDYETAVACFHSDEYQEVAAIRRASASSEIVIVEGAG